MSRKYKTRAKYKDGALIPLEVLDLTNDMEVEIIILEDSSEGAIKTADLMKLAENDESLDFLNDPKEDIYNLDDLKEKFE